MPEHPPEASQEQNGGYERTDLRIEALLAGLAGTLVLLVVAFVGMYGFLQWGPSMQERPFARGPLPPGPRLETTPRSELLKILEREQGRLREYRWIDRDAGVVQIPIERAMSLVEDRGLAAVEAGWKDR